MAEQPSRSVELICRAWYSKLFQVIVPTILAVALFAAGMFTRVWYEGVRA
jgi:hypothetical protein